MTDNELKEFLIKKFPPFPDLSKVMTMRQMMQRYILRAMVSCEFNRESASRKIKISRRTLYKYLKAYEKQSGKKFPQPDPSCYVRIKRAL